MGTQKKKKKAAHLKEIRKKKNLLPISYWPGNNRGWITAQGDRVMLNQLEWLTQHSRLQ